MATCLDRVTDVSLTSNGRSLVAGGRDSSWVLKISGVNFQDKMRFLGPRDQPKSSFATIGRGSILNILRIMYIYIYMLE